MNIKPCPFCGETPDIKNPYTFQEVETCKWGALVCCCKGPAVRTGYGHVDDWKMDAVDEWDKRAGDSELASLRAKLAEAERDAGRWRTILPYLECGKVGESTVLSLASMFHFRGDFTPEQIVDALAQREARK